MYEYSSEHTRSKGTHIGKTRPQTRIEGTRLPTFQLGSRTLSDQAAAANELWDLLVKPRKCVRQYAIGWKSQNSLAVAACFDAEALYVV